MEYLAALFIPGRRTVGTLHAAFEKFEVQYVVGCAEPSVVKRYADQKGLLLTLAGWQPAAIQEGKGAPRLTLPDDLVGLFTNIHGAARDGFEVTLITPAKGMRYHAQVKLARLSEPMAVGCRYQVAS